jgi:hypothetical protein
METVIESQQRIIQAVAESLIEKLVNQVIKNLQKLDVCLSGLENGTTWDDICIQVQSGISSYWDMYEDMINGFIDLELEKLTFEEKMAIWFQTETGKKLIQDYIFNFEEGLGCEDLEEPGYDKSAVLNFLFSKIWRKAGEWSNKRIRQYL